MSTNTFVKTKRFTGPKTFGGGGGGGNSWGPRKSLSENGKPVGDLRSVLAKKQSANITDLRTKLKPKALYTSNLASRSQTSLKQGANGTDTRGQARKPLKLTPTFKYSVSSAVSRSGGSKPSRERESQSTPTSHRSRSSSHKLPSYEEAKKISVTVPGLSRPTSEVRI